MRDKKMSALRLGVRGHVPVAAEVAVRGISGVARLFNDLPECLEPRNVTPSCTKAGIMRSAHALNPNQLRATHPAARIVANTSLVYTAT